MGKEGVKIIAAFLDECKYYGVKIDALHRGRKSRYTVPLNVEYTNLTVTAVEPTLRYMFMH
jgi:hypothetical protein